MDLVAEWKIVDARWYEVFAKASLAHQNGRGWRGGAFTKLWPLLALRSDLL